MPTARSFRALILVGLAAASWAAAAPLKLAPCTPPGLTGEGRCGTYEVFENRAAGTGRKVPLAVVVLPATGPKREPDPLVYFAGGPGDSATAAAPGLAHSWAALRESRDIVLIDVRGTGQSQPLNCSSMMGDRGVQGFLDAFLPVEGVRACRREHERTADLAQYTTANAIDDVAEVLSALGYERANLVGGSFGTKAALTFIERHPRQARTAFLEGMVPPDSRSPLTFARDAQAALDGTLAECADDPACAKAFPRVREELAAVLERLSAAPVTVEVRQPWSGQLLALRLNRQGFAQVVRYMLYSPASAILVPLYVHAAWEGNFRPLAEFAALFGSFITSLSDGFFLSVTCGEEVPFIDEQEAAAAVRGTFLGDFRIRAQQAACGAWGVPPQPRSVLAPVRSDVPVVIVSGERDPVTPARWGEEVARTLTHARHVVVADGAHGSEGMKGADCLDGLLAQLVQAGSVERLDTACVAAIERPAFATELPPPGVDVAPERLAALAGTYGSAEAGMEVRLEVIEGRLRLAFRPDDAYFLVPLSPARFRVEGLPAGYAVEFEERDGRVTAVRLVEGSEVTVLPRR